MFVTFRRGSCSLWGAAPVLPHRQKSPRREEWVRFLQKKKIPDNFVVPHVETVLADVYAVGDKATDGDEVSVEPVEANNNIGVRPKTSNPNLNR